MWAVKVGNQDFADWVDEHVTVSHINNKYVPPSRFIVLDLTINLTLYRKDPVPILPGNTYRSEI